MKYAQANFFGMDESGSERFCSFKDVTWDEVAYLIECEQRDVKLAREWEGPHGEQYINVYFDAYEW